MYLHIMDFVFASNSVEDPESFRHLAHANNTSERMWKIYFKILAAAFMMNFVITPALSVLVNRFAYYDSNVDNFFHPAPYLYVEILTNVADKSVCYTYLFTFQLAMESIDTCGIRR